MSSVYQSTSLSRGKLDVTQLSILLQQYSAGLVQYKNEFNYFGNFDPKEVKKEVKRGNKLVSIYGKYLMCISSDFKIDGYFRKTT